VAVFSRREPLRVEYELPDPDYQGEGRALHLEFPELHFFNIYFPNGGEELEKGVFKRVPYKMGFFDAFLAYAEELRQDKPIVVCGDFNISHREIDLARPRETCIKPDFCPKNGLDGPFCQAGYVDTLNACAWR
jgi:exodeoxyribonuclease-3